MTHSIETIADHVPEPWGRAIRDHAPRAGWSYLASNRCCDRRAPADRLGAVPPLAIEPRSQALLIADQRVVVGLNLARHDAC
jgi:hypothetical protein